MFRGLIRGFEVFTQVIIARTIEVSMCRRGPAQLYLGHEVSTAKGLKESYYNMGLMGLMGDYKKKGKRYGLYLILLDTAKDLFGLKLRLCF